MKQLVVLSAIFAIGTVATEAAVIQMNRFSNTDHNSPVTDTQYPAKGWVSTDGGASTNASAVYDVSTFVTNDVALSHPLAYTVTGLDIDGVGGANDKIVVKFTVTGVGGNLQTSWGNSEPNNAGWLSAGDLTLDADGEYVQFDYVSMSVDLNGGTGNGSGTFNGFSAVEIGAFEGGDTAVANGITLAYSSGSKTIDLTPGGLDSNLQVIYDSAQGSTGAGYRAADWSFEVEAIPEPASMGLIMAFGGAIFFIRRKLTM